MASISKRSNAWSVEVVYYIDGKRKKRRKSGFKTKSLAQQWANEMEVKKQSGELASSNGLFLDEMKRWYTIFKEPKISRETKLWYQNAFRIVEESWKNKKLNDIKTADFQLLLNKYSNNHVKSSINRIRTIITAFVRYAVDEEMIRKDFTKNVSITSKKKSKTADQKYLENDEITKLIKRCKETDFISSRMILTQLFMGMRYAEVAGLTPEDVDLENKTINIHQTWDMVVHEFKPTKNESSNRIVTVPDELVSMMKEWKFGKDFVFQTRNGYPMTNNGVNKALREFLIADGSKVITSHGLRHTHASYLLANDISIQYVSERLGHETIKTTIETYSHLLDEKRKLENKKAIDKLNQLL